MIKQKVQEESTSKVKLAIAATIALAAVGGAVWAVVGKHGDTKPTVEVPQQFALDTLKKAEPGPAMWEQMRGLRDRKDLTDEQRDQIRDNMRAAMDARMKAHVDEYFAANGEEKKKVLDKHIDEFQKMREDMEARRKQEGNQAGGPPGDKPRGEGDRGQGGPGGRGGGSREQRMTRTQSRNPDQMAKRMAYMAAVAERMKERGIQPPQWGGGPRGPRG